MEQNDLPMRDSSTVSTENIKRHVNGFWCAKQSLRSRKVLLVLLDAVEKDLSNANGDGCLRPEIHRCMGASAFRRRGCWQWRVANILRRRRVKVGLVLSTVEHDTDIAVCRSEGRHIAQSSVGVEGSTAAQLRGSREGANLCESGLAVAY